VNPTIRYRLGTFFGFTLNPTALQPKLQEIFTTTLSNIFTSTPTDMKPMMNMNMLLSDDESQQDTIVNVASVLLEAMNSLVSQSVPLKAKLAKSSTGTSPNSNPFMESMTPTYNSAMEKATQDFQTELAAMMSTDSTDTSNNLAEIPSALMESVKSNLKKLMDDTMKVLAEVDVKEGGNTESGKKDPAGSGGADDKYNYDGAAGTNGTTTAAGVSVAGNSAESANSNAAAPPVSRGMKMDMRTSGVLGVVSAMFGLMLVM
jgi:hypothetical protein